MRILLLFVVLLVGCNTAPENPTVIKVSGGDFKTVYEYELVSTYQSKDGSNGLTFRNMTDPIQKDVWIYDDHNLFNHQLGSKIYIQAK